MMNTTANIQTTLENDLSKMNFKRKIKIYGLRRSGNHMIIEWILSHFNNGIHLNDVNHVKNPDKWYWDGKKMLKINYYNKKINYDVLIESYEDFLPKKIDNETLIILRDWYNICASRHVSGRGWEDSCSRNSCPKLYLKYCDYYEENKDKYILYNYLITNDEYVKTLEKQLGFINHKEIPNKFPKSKIGSGSSFNNLNKEELNKRYLKLIEKYPDEWGKIKGFNEINKYMESIFKIQV